MPLSLCYVSCVWQFCLKKLVPFELPHPFESDFCWPDVPLWSVQGRWNKALVEKIGLALVGGAPTLVIFGAPCFGMNCSMNRKPCGCIGKSRQTGDGRNQFWHFFHDLSSSFSQSNCCHDPEFSDTVAASRVAGFFQCDWQWWVIHRIQQMLSGCEFHSALFGYSGSQLRGSLGLSQFSAGSAKMQACCSHRCFKP